MGTSAIHDGYLKPEALKARILLIVAEALEGIAVVWIACCAGGLFLVVAIAPRLSDAIADGVPLLLAGGLGFTLGWWTALLTRRIAAAQPRRSLRLARRGRQRRKTPVISGIRAQLAIGAARVTGLAVSEQGVHPRSGSD